MARKILVTTITVAASTLALSYFANRHFTDDQSKSKPTGSIDAQWAPVPQNFTVDEAPKSAQTESKKGLLSDETAFDNTGPSVLESSKLEILNGLSSEMQAMYEQLQQQDLEFQQTLAQEIDHPSDARKLPTAEQQLLSAAIAQIPGANLDSTNTASIAWQPAEEEFALPDEEHFYGAQVYQACADAMCKLQFQGFGDETSRDFAIERLISTNKIPQGSMIVPDDNDYGRFMVLYLKKQS